MFERIQLSSEVAAASRRWVDSDELKTIVRDEMILMDQSEREQLIIDLEREMKRAGFFMCSHLIQIGIPASSICEMTPNEVGHFVRFVDMTEPQLMPAIERVLSRHIAFLREEETLAICPAA